MTTKYSIYTCIKVIVFRLIIIQRKIPQDVKISASSCLMLRTQTPLSLKSLCSSHLYKHVFSMPHCFFHSLTSKQIWLVITQKRRTVTSALFHLCSGTSFVFKTSIHSVYLVPKCLEYRNSLLKSNLLTVRTFVTICGYKLCIVQQNAPTCWQYWL